MVIDALAALKERLLFRYIFCPRLSRISSKTRGHVFCTCSFRAHFRNPPSNFLSRLDPPPGLRIRFRGAQKAKPARLSSNIDSFSREGGGFGFFSWRFSFPWTPDSFSYRERHFFPLQTLIQKRANTRKTVTPTPGADGHYWDPTCNVF